MKEPDLQAESERLRAYYARLPEEELVQIGSQYESLTDSAKAAIRAEFDRRSLPAPELAEPEDHEFQALVTVGRYLDQAHASVAKSVLESAGIHASLRDENTARIDWGTSIALGGIRLQVRPEDQAAAEEALSQPIPSVIDAEGIQYEQPRCPACRSLDISMLWARSTWSCASCDAKWEDVQDP